MNISPLNFSEDFSTGSPLIKNDDPFIRVDPVGNHDLRLRGIQHFDLPFGYVEDLRFIADIYLRRGSLYFSVRQSGAGGYTVVIQASGRVILRRGDERVAVAQLSDINALKSGATIRIDSRGNRVTVRIAGERLIVFDDPQPLPYGTISFGSFESTDTRATIDNLQLAATIATDVVGGWMRIQSMMQEDPRSLARLEGDERVYFTRWNDTVREVWSSNPDGTNQHLIAKPGNYPEISPDGNRLAFISNRDGAFRVWVKFEEGLLFQVSPPNTGGDYLPSWAPDNMRLAYVSNLLSAADSLNIIDLRTGAITEGLASSSTFCDVDWSPVSDRILIVYGMSTCIGLSELRLGEGPNGSTLEVPVLGGVPNGNLASLRGVAYSGDGTRMTFGYTTINATQIYRIGLADIPEGSQPQSAAMIYEAFESDPCCTNLGTITDVVWNPASGSEMAFQIQKPGDADEINYLSISGIGGETPTGTLLSTSISDALGKLSWHGNAEFDPTYERCVSVPVPTLDPTQGVSISLLDDYAQTPSITNTPLPPGYRLEFTGKVINAAQTPWLEVNAVIPDYAGSPTPAATYAAPYWLSAGAFSSGSIYLDPCDDDAQINDPQEGFTGDSYYLPLLEQAERTLTPTYTPALSATPYPQCEAEVTTSANFRVEPGAHNDFVDGQPGLQPNWIVAVHGRTAEQLYNEANSTYYYWYLVRYVDQDPEPELGVIRTGWIVEGVFDFLPLGSPNPGCISLPLYSNIGDPLATATVTATRTQTATPTLGPTATRIPRIVVTQAQPLHAIADQVGLPLPFDIFPVSDDIVRQNGFGPNSYSFSDQAGCYIGPGTPIPPSEQDICQYRGTSRIHPGLDYYTVPADSSVEAVCDGVIVAGPAGLNGGTALINAGAGLSLRCFAVEPNDPDGNNQRNLSNVIVVYNHLALAENVNSNSYQIIRKGDVLGTSTSYITSAGIDVASHLDFQIFLANGFRTQSALLINPTLMFAAQIQQLPMPYPNNVPSAPNEEFDQWWLQAQDGDANFWANVSLQSVFIRDVANNLSTVYQSTYIGPNCPELAPDTVDFGLNVPMENPICTQTDFDSDN